MKKTVRTTAAGYLKGRLASPKVAAHVPSQQPGPFSAASRTKAAAKAAQEAAHGAA